MAGTTANTFILTVFDELQSPVKSDKRLYEVLTLSFLNNYSSLISD